MPTILQQGSPSDHHSIGLFTRKKSFIENVRRMEAPPDRMRAAVQICLAVSPDVKLRSATQTYNCMGMVFASRRTWVDPDQLSKIQTDDEYKELHDLKDARVGDVVVYGQKSTVDEITHVGIIVEMSSDIEHGQWKVTVMSQWGADGEYFHPLNAVPPTLGSFIKVLTDRKETS